MSESAAHADSSAQHPPRSEPLREHEWLHTLVGEWTYEYTIPAHGAHAAHTVVGSETVRSLGGIWIVGEGRGEASGGGVDTSMITLGFDPEKARFVGTWVGSMMPYLWLYEGELDPQGRVLTLNSTGPSMAGDGTTTQYQDIIELVSPDHRTLTARVLETVGTWKEFMTMTYRRRK
jgi:hypothetical protein